MFIELHERSSRSRMLVNALQIRELREVVGDEYNHGQVDGTNVTESYEEVRALIHAATLGAMGDLAGLRARGNPIAARPLETGFRLVETRPVLPLSDGPL